jgi:hypothetical protein
LPARARLCLTLAAAATTLPLCACQLVFPTVAEAEAGAGDAARGCGPADGGYHDLTTKACWSTYTVPPSLDPNPSFVGGSFDGRYLYFGSNLTGRVVRYDSRSPFTADGSWSSFAPAQGKQYSGVIFDGRYAYFVPGPSSSTVTAFIRYDTKADFEAKTSWQSFVLGSNQYQGGTFDGRYVYFAAFQDKMTNPTGAILRYDTRQEFTTAGSWSTFDTFALPGPLAAYAVGFYGAVFDGGHVYFVPAGGQKNVVARYDTSVDFASTSSWELFDTRTGNSDEVGFATGIFDGKYVYLVPSYASEFALQYDIAEPFTATASWKRHVPAPGSGAIGIPGTPQFVAGGFDGRYLYDVPGSSVIGTMDGLLVRHDATNGDFAAAGWASFNTMSIHAATFGAAVFDGQYLYLAPWQTLTFARFDAKDPPGQPRLPEYFGSFF